jgi:demethylmenaquinone methyltransferase/2-methoxy-6-polyprenyl-1,4-benzoquinol methylase
LIADQHRTDMVAYYRQRAGEYERIYTKPERQDDLARMRAAVARFFAGEHVLELSCGTGYWTQTIAAVAASVTACDINPPVLEIARSKNWESRSVEFLQADSYALPDFGRRHSAGFAGFWWSHIPKRTLGEFLTSFRTHLAAGAKVMFIDNRYVEGSSTPVSRVDAAGDSFQQRRLDDGSVHEVLKNFPSKEELLNAIADASSAEVILAEYFWILTYTLR